MQREIYLKELLTQQKKLTEDLEKKVEEINTDHLVLENEALQTELSKCKVRLEEADSKVTRLSEENKSLKNLLYEQIYNEKLAILNTVNHKVDAYYQGNTNAEMNRLKFFEAESKRRIDQMMNILVNYRISSQDEIYGRLRELSELLNYKVAEAVRLYQEQAGAFYNDRNAEYQRLHEEGITETEMKNALKKNNIESLIGLNIVNKIGILFLIIGVIAAAQFTYFKLPELFKGIFMFALGVILLIAGELLNRKKPNVFSLGITSGGVAILYAAVAISYFGLDLITMYPALALCIIITALSFYLSQRYHSQTIAAFSLIGGYLPIFSISADKALVYSAMVYFFILNIFSLMIAFRKKWSAAALIGFIANLVSSVYIMSLTLGGIADTASFTLNGVLTVLYITFVFLIYTLIPLASAYRTGKKLNGLDVTMLACNTFISALLLYIAFYQTAFIDYKGLLAVLFAVSYFLLARLTGAKLKQEKAIQILFYLTSFAFVILIVPLQLDKIWLSLGWLVEGVLIVTYGILRNEKNFLRYGYIINGICLGTFLLLDLLPYLIGYHTFFTYKYLSVTLGSLVIMAAYLYKKQLTGVGVRILKYCTYINLWAFVLYMITVELSKVILHAVAGTGISGSYLTGALRIAAGFLLAYTVPRIKALNDTGMKLISMGITVLSVLQLIILNGHGIVLHNKAPLGITLLAALILIVINALSILSMMDFVKGLVLDKVLGVEWYPPIISMYFVSLLTQNLIAQYHLEFTNFIFSILYLTLAFSWIIFGFVKKYAFIRRFGLGLSFLAVAKLFLIDLSFLTQGYRIISYFAFGFILIAISFVYQYFNKRLEVKL